MTDNVSSPLSSAPASPMSRPEPMNEEQNAAYGRRTLPTGPPDPSPSSLPTVDDYLNAVEDKEELAEKLDEEQKARMMLEEELRIQSERINKLEVEMREQIQSLRKANADLRAKYDLASSLAPASDQSQTVGRPNKRRRTELHEQTEETASDTHAYGGFPSSELSSAAKSPTVQSVGESSRSRINETSSISEVPPADSTAQEMHFAGRGMVQDMANEVMPVGIPSAVQDEAAVVVEEYLNDEVKASTRQMICLFSRSKCSAAINARSQHGSGTVACQKCTDARRRCLRLHEREFMVVPLARVLRPGMSTDEVGYWILGNGKASGKSIWPSKKSK